MIFKLKKQLGYIKRGLVGIIKNYADQAVVSANISKSEIGSSISGQPIDLYKIGSGNRKIIVVGGIHGNEIGSIKVTRHLTNWVSENRKQYPGLTFYIIPCLNPDGYAKALKHPDYWKGGLIGRFNNNNVDLNRNLKTSSFQTQSIWSRGKNYSETISVDCGSKPLSEPETEALVNFIKQEQISIYIGLHNSAADVMGSNDLLGEKLAKIFSQNTGYKLITHEDWLGLKQTGTAKEWCDSNNITYLEIEGRDRWSADWAAQKSGLEAVFRELS